MPAKLDCRGLACPAPVLQTKQVIERDNPGEITVIVDNGAAKENISRFLGSQRFSVSVEQSGPDFHINGKRVDGAAPNDFAIGPSAGLEKQKIMVMIATDRMGFGDDELGKKLVVSFINTLKEMGDELWRLVFVNNGVKLTVSGSGLAETLRTYEKEGVTILVCGTCLNHFNLLDKKQVGETTNMLDIVTAMQLADKVISI